MARLVDLERSLKNSTNVVSTEESKRLSVAMVASRMEKSHAMAADIDTRASVA